MHVSFTLTMPNNNSWNGKWSGEGRSYVRVLTVSDAKKTRAKFEKLAGNHYYNFGDGWGANVEVKEVTGAEKRKLTKQSAGFCGYDWMIESLRSHGKILNDQQRAAYIKERGKEAYLS
jgi:hypothetical protein